jgi:ABC-type multidrug transport system ATPase subunit
MSERILKALMQLFAIIAKVEDNDIGENIPSGKNDGRKIVLDFLKRQLNQELTNEYIKVFDEYVDTHQGKRKKKDGSKKRTSMNSVKVLRICTQINEELAQKQKIIVLLRILEFIKAGIVTEQEQEFAETVAETFNISTEEYKLCYSFTFGKEGEFTNAPEFLIINNVATEEFEEQHKDVKHLFSAGIATEMRVLRVPSVGLYFLRYFGTQNIALNGQNIEKDRIYVLTHGSSIRGPKVKPIYQSDIINRFLSDTVSEKITFKAKDITYVFKGGNIGLHPLTIEEESGKLLGIMGGSGAGKSTLLNLLNGNYKPTTGKVTINGIDIHSKEAKEKMEGIIGYVSQDDLLIEELTVFQNLFYNAKLCFGDMSDDKIKRLVLKLLADLGLSETKDLKVGSPLEKTISGGQRKRVNIGLELIREPAVLFVDEPTSGLSSRDSQNIMDLLKELTLKGKLIFVVIHQPSSDIFKMFDKLLILDLGGYPVYNANPVDGISYFKDLANYADVNDDTSGNVNPEEIFDIIDAKVVDEYGNLTDKRKKKPVEWYEIYKERIASKEDPVKDVEEAPKASFKIPNVFKQFGVFFVRDVLSKFTNTQYMLVNMLEAPLLAAILAFFVKYFRTDANASGEYIFRESENLPQFLFISVVVALFIGLTVSAEEIIKDQKILKREKFLNLSKVSYLNSKISIMFIISAIQTLFYVLVGNYILEIQGMTWPYWLVMFSISCFANMLGLNISASFNSAKVIYILIPILIIPQLLFSGVIVSFDKIHPAFASDKGVPFIGNVMASRWAYEAMAVTQYKENAFESQFYELEKTKKLVTFKKDFWAGTLEDAITYIKNNHDRIPELEEEIAQLKSQEEGDEDIKIKIEKKKEEIKEIRKSLPEKVELLKNEIKKEEEFLPDLKCNCTDKITYKNPDIEYLTSHVKDHYLGTLKKHYRKVYKSKSEELEKILVKLNKSEKAKAEFEKMKDEYTNNALSDFVTNKNSTTKILVKNGEIINKMSPIHFDADPKEGFFGAHFYAPNKYIFGKKLDTLTANVLVIWMMSFVLMITLYFDALKKLLDGMGKLFSKISFKKKR